MLTHLERAQDALVDERSPSQDASRLSDNRKPSCARRTKVEMRSKVSGARLDRARLGSHSAGIVISPALGVSCGQPGHYSCQAGAAKSQT